jgi:hypothetical protein
MVGVWSIGMKAISNIFLKKPKRGDELRRIFKANDVNHRD